MISEEATLQAADLQKYRKCYSKPLPPKFIDAVTLLVESNEGGEGKVNWVGPHQVLTPVSADLQAFPPLPMYQFFSLLLCFSCCAVGLVADCTAPLFVLSFQSCLVYLWSSL
jgi:hypothetical protein